jgi:hypothetical protein
VIEALFAGIILNASPWLFLYFFCIFAMVEAVCSGLFEGYFLWFLACREKEELATAFLHSMDFSDLAIFDPHDPNKPFDKWIQIAPKQTV